jgi:hypothetical protein
MTTMQIPTDWTFADFLERSLPPTSALSELYELEIAARKVAGPQT